MIENLQGIEGPIDPARLQQLLQKRSALYDKHEEGHYQLISALHKAVRGSDPDAALYWLARMLEGGESPEYIARRMVRMAVEDIGLADPEALQITLNAWQSIRSARIARRRTGASSSSHLSRSPPKATPPIPPLRQPKSSHPTPPNFRLLHGSSMPRLSS